MTRSVLLLRAVNVSGRNLVPMGRLRELLAPLLGDVSTYIASGNVVCAHLSDAAATCQQVRVLIADEFGVDTPVIARTHEDLVGSLALQPFEAAQENLLHAMFLEASPAPGAIPALTERLVPGEQIALVGRDLWINYSEGGVHSTKLTKTVLDRALGVAGTARNLRTVRKLVALTA